MSCEVYKWYVTIPVLSRYDSRFFFGGCETSRPAEDCFVVWLRTPDGTDWSTVLAVGRVPGNKMSLQTSWLNDTVSTWRLSVLSEICCWWSLLGAHSFHTFTRFKLSFMFAKLILRLLRLPFPSWQGKDEFFVERVFPDSALWDVCVERPRLFFQDVLLPELVGKRYTSTS